MNTIEDTVEQLLAKAVAGDKDDAMRYSQAALNAAHAHQVLAQTDQTKREGK